MDGLILSSVELLHCMDKGYAAGENDEARFPIRLSGLGNCPRATRAQLDAPADREFGPRMLRIFEQGHDRGEKLANALRDGIELHICERDPEWYTFSKDQQEELMMELGSRFEYLVEEEVWCPTKLKGDLARKAISHAREWNRRNGVDPDAELPMMLSPEDVLCIRGRADVIITDKETKQFWVIDFKTKASWGFKKLIEEGNGYGYEIQVLSYVSGFIHGSEAGWTCEGAFLYYEDHEKRNHIALPVDLDVGVLDIAIDRVSKVLRNWVHDGPISEAPAVYAESVNWTKKVHVKALGCLPWQCNYCAIGPVAGECLDTDVFQLKDIRKPGTEIPKWEILDA